MNVNLILPSSLIGVLFFSLFATVTSADDGSGCDSSNTQDQILCYDKKIYEQNSQLIKLGEINVCYDQKNYWDVNHGISAGFSLNYPYAKCIDLLDSETK